MHVHNIMGLTLLLCLPVAGAYTSRPEAEPLPPLGPPPWGKSSASAGELWGELMRPRRQDQLRGLGRAELFDTMLSWYSIFRDDDTKVGAVWAPFPHFNARG